LIHFFEDFKHFENAFWITNKKFSIQSSCFNQRITLRQNIFLSGSRSIVYFNPFYSLFTSCYFSKCRKPLETSADKETTVTAKNRYFESNTPKKGQAEKASKYHYEILNFGYTSVAQLVSIQKNATASQKLSNMNYWIDKKIQLVKKNNTRSEII